MFEKEDTHVAKVAKVASKVRQQTQICYIATDWKNYNFPRD